MFSTDSIIGSGVGNASSISSIVLALISCDNNISELSKISVFQISPSLFPDLSQSGILPSEPVISVVISGTVDAI
jgi:hypothetical protein